MDARLGRGGGGGGPELGIGGGPPETRLGGGGGGAPELRVGGGGGGVTRDPGRFGGAAKPSRVFFCTAEEDGGGGGGADAPRDDFLAARPSNTSRSDPLSLMKVLALLICHTLASEAWREVMPPNFPPDHYDRDARGPLPESAREVIGSLA